MRRLNLGSWGVLALVLLIARVAFAQDVPPEPPAPLIDWTDILQKILALPAVVAAVLAVLKHGVSFVPNRFLPIIGAGVALLADVLAQLNGTNLTPAPMGAASAVTAVVLGLAATGGHQTVQAPRTAKQIKDLEDELDAARREAGLPPLPRTS